MSLFAGRAFVASAACSGNLRHRVLAVNPFKIAHHERDWCPRGWFNGDVVMEIALRLKGEEVERGGGRRREEGRPWQ